MEAAMNASSSMYEFRLRWEPYLLKPNMPPEGLPIPAEYSNPNNPRVQYVRQVASSLGIEFNINRKKFANTVMAHALLEYAKQVDGGDKQDLVSEKLFKRCFTDAEDMQIETCLSVASECGLDTTIVQQYLTNPDSLTAVVNKAMQWAERGISGVPTFYFNGQKMFSGAQGPEVFTRMFEVVVERFPAESPASKS